jgi:hypothetical protein
MDRFRVVVWCEACRGDDEGCFGGVAQVIGAAYESHEAAEKAGAHYCSDLPYRYRVELADVTRASSVRAPGRGPLSMSFEPFALS